MMLPCLVIALVNDETRLCRACCGLQASDYVNAKGQHLIPDPDIGDFLMGLLGSMRAQANFSLELDREL
jgi:hypothetical protein